MAELYKQLAAYGDSDYYPFHMPGHKRNKEAAKGILAEVYGIDITEIDGFDNLHQAEGILKREQERAAAIYGAEKTYFLVNGSTGGILSAVSAVCKRGGRILMARNCHKSVYHAVYLQELEISYLYPEPWKEYKAAGAVDPEAVETALREMSDIEAVIVTSPTYEGIVSDVKRIADIVHRYGKPLIVDEAHGAHFGFHEAYPDNSVKLGADIVIHSLHKTLPSMTQTALLHVNGNLVDKRRLERFLKIFQTSSPSYVLMASISGCLDLLSEEGAERLAVLKERRDRMEERIKGHNFIKTGKIENKSLAVNIDPCKMVIYAKEGIVSGRQLYDILREKYHLQMEMAADGYVLAIFSMMDTQEGMDRLDKALSEIDQAIAEGKISEGKVRQVPAGINDGDRTVMSVFQAYHREQEKVELEKGCGRVAAEFINLYPPGIPLAVPGERLDAKTIERLLSYEEAGLKVQGVERGYIRVVKSGQDQKDIQ